MITNPVGIDFHIQNLQTNFAANLFAGKTYTSYGRAFITNSVPEVYNGSNEYQEVLQDDSLNALSFFTVLPDEEVQGTEARARVNIYFFVNLEKLFTYTHRAVEEVHILVLKEINYSPFQVTRLVSGVESVRDFTINRPELMDMQPYYCFKFECTITYKLC